MLDRVRTEANLSPADDAVLDNLGHPRHRIGVSRRRASHEASAHAVVLAWIVVLLAAADGANNDEPRPGPPRTISAADVERVIVATLESTLTDATHWSTRSMASHVGLSQSAVSRIWRAFALQPHRTHHRQGP